MQKKFLFHCLGAMALGLLIAPNVSAQLAVESERIESVIPEIDGTLSEWSGWQDEANSIAFTLLGGPEIVAGSEGWDHPEDYSASIAFAHDDKALYFAATIHDEAVVRTDKALVSEDHLEVRIALLKGAKGDFRSFGLGIFADPVNKVVEVRKLAKNKRSASKVLPDVKAAISGTANAYSIEMRIPWSVLPMGVAKRSGMRAAVFAVDCDSPGGKAEDTVLGTAPIQARTDHLQLPLFGFSDVTRPVEDFWKRMNLSPRLTARFLAAFDMAAGKEMEQVIVADKYLMAFGPEIANKDHYSFVELPIASSEHVVRFEYFDVTGDSKKDVILEFAVDNGTDSKRWISIYNLDKDYRLQKIFSAATLIDSLVVTVENDLKFVKGPGRSLAVRVTPKKTKGLDEALGESAPELDGNPMVVPWDVPAHVTYTFLEGRYVRD